MNNQLEPYKEDNYKPDYKNEEAYLRAKKKVEKLTGFYWHLAVYIVINLFLIVVVSVNSGDGFWSFSTFATPLFWGIGLLFHFLGVFGQDVFFGKDWEKRKIDDYIKRDQEEMRKYE